jgi:nitrogen fixation/metabolism regulation signal transduction histidine kinase
MKAEGAKLSSQRDSLVKVRKSLVFGVVGGISLMVLFVAIAGVYFTHKVAGPIHRMRLLFREVGEGKFSPYRPLRKGDELQDFFADFSAMVEKLKDRQKEEIKRLDEAIAKAEKAGVSDGSLYDLRAVRDAMETALVSRPSEVMKLQS